MYSKESNQRLFSMVKKCCRTPLDTIKFVKHIKEVCDKELVALSTEWIDKIVQNINSKHHLT